MKAKPLSDEAIGHIENRLGKEGYFNSGTIGQLLATIESKNKLIKVREEAAQDLGKKLRRAEGRIEVKDKMSEDAVAELQKSRNEIEAHKSFANLGIKERDHERVLALKAEGEVKKLKEENEKLRLDILYWKTRHSLKNKLGEKIDK